MRDLMSLMKSAGELQEKMTALQEELKSAEAKGTSGGGLVTVTLNGRGDLKSLDIDASLVAESDKTIIEDLIIAAHADAKGKIEAMMQDRMSELTAGLPIPPGMKLPF
ncbi:MAG: YbaB/EbfC family nucleoid-associated protein [Alphaproteobacteria bacterium]|nr:YbaB/EbfC family nucleoid-associated protein [Alphaproteobacteria bacterium]